MEIKTNSNWSADQELSYQVTILITKIKLGEPDLVKKIQQAAIGSGSDKRLEYAKCLAISPYKGHILEIAESFNVSPDDIYNMVAMFLDHNDKAGETN